MIKIIPKYNEPRYKFRPKSYKYNVHIPTYTISELLRYTYSSTWESIILCSRPEEYKKKVSEYVKKFATEEALRDPSQVRGVYIEEKTEYLTEALRQDIHFCFE